MQLNDRALAGLTVLDITGAMANYTGKLFAELGADVVLVEPMDGSELRHRPPFATPPADPPTSLRFVANNTGKRSICVDLEHPGGQQIVRTLARHADLVIEDRQPGALAALGIGPAQLRAENPRLVVTSVTGFGQDGPYSHYAASDLVCLALGGLLSLAGEPDEPPLHAAAEQAYAAGSLFAAVASMLALTHAELTGEGQLVDVSVQEAVTMALENAAQFYHQEGTVRRRLGFEQRQAGYGVYHCADGYVVLIAGGLGGNRFWGNLVTWMSECGDPGATPLAEPQWADRTFLKQQHAMDTFREIFERFAMTRTKAELYRGAQAHRVPLCPVNSVAEMVASPQLAHRQFFTTVAAGAAKATAPGAPYRLSMTAWANTGPAPGLGEHTDDVLNQFGWQPEDIHKLRAEGIVK